MTGAATRGWDRRHTRLRKGAGVGNACCSLTQGVLRLALRRLHGARSLTCCRHEAELVLRYPQYISTEFSNLGVCGQTAGWDICSAHWNYVGQPRRL